MAALQVSPISDIFSYVSAPTSPGRGCNNLNGGNFLFLSVPTSPTRQLSRASSGLDSLPITPETKEGFAFDANQRFLHGTHMLERCPHVKYCHQPHLKLPPRLQRVGSSNTNNHSRISRSKPGSAASSPGSRSSRFRNPFSHRAARNDGFDPFTAAFEKIRDGKMVKKVKGSYQLQHRKSFSLSVSPVLKKAPPVLRPSQSAKWDSNSSPKKKILKPDGNSYEKKWGFDFGIEHEEESIDGRVRAVKKGLIGRYGGTMERRIKRFLLKNASFGRKIDEEKREHKVAMLEKQCDEEKRIKRFLLKNASFGRKIDEGKRERKVAMLETQCASKKCSSKGGQVTKQTSSNAMVKITGEIKSLIKYRPRILSCSSFSSKGARAIQP